MDAPRRAALGLGLAGAAYLLAFVTGGAQPVPFWLGFLAAGLGLLAAAAGPLALPAPRAPLLLAVGFALAAAGMLATVLTALGRGVSPYSAGHALGLLALLQGAWLSLLWRVEGTGGAARRLAGLQVTLLALTAAWGLYLLLNLTGFTEFLPGSLLGLAGLATAARAVGELRRDAGRAPEVAGAPSTP
jgi:hypothetical protein